MRKDLEMWRASWVIQGAQSDHKVLQCVEEGSRRVRVKGCSVRNPRRAIAGFEEGRGHESRNIGHL